MGCTKSTPVADQPTDAVFIVFVLGGPGVGKGTQCKRICEKYGYTHLSTGDLFRAEVKKDSQRAKQVEDILKSGSLVPVEITLDILYDAVHDIIQADNTKTKLLLDGFPRELSQVTAFQEKFHRPCDFALFYEGSEEVMISRCLERGKSSGRSDDNEESLKQRVQTYRTNTQPVADYFKEQGLLKTVNADNDIDTVWNDTQALFDTFEMSDKPATGITITVCGGGNAAHIAAGMFAKNGATVNLFFSFEEEAQKFRVACEANDGVTIETKTTSYKGKPAVITADPKEAIPDSDLILLIVPAFAHEPILKQIAPHLKENAFVGAIPGPGAFDLIAINALGSIRTEKNITLYAGTSLPWACRFEEYGKRASLLGEKTKVGINARPNEPKSNAELADKMTRLHDNTTFSCSGNFLISSLWPTNCVIHTGISYGIWHDWDGKPLDEAPLFYQNCNAFTGNVLDQLSNEIAACVEILKNEGADMGGWLPIDKYLVDVYGDVIDDHSSTAQIFATNDAFRGLKAPVTTTDDGKVLPNFRTRYLTEDLPHGLAVLRGVAEICGVETPMMDTVLLWAQPKIEKEYLVDGKIQGKDIANSGCPQRFGITTVKQLIKGEM